MDGDGTGVMAVWLWVLGAVTTASGLGLGAFGAAMHGAAFGGETLTPAAIASVGGLLLIGMGLAVRALQRIERALVVREVSRPARPDVGPAATAAEAASPNVPVAPKQNASPQPAPAETHPAQANAAPTAGEVASLETLRAKFPTLGRLETAPVVEGANVSLMPRAPSRGDEGIDPKDAAPISGAANGATPNRGQRPGANPRQSASPEKPRSLAFNSFWPAKPRGAAQTAALQAAAPMPPPLPAPESVADARAVGEPERTAAPVTILKSGVVEGMAYTLYSDGSIEAQLPQGTLRFGSLTALRDHIDNAS